MMYSGSSSRWQAGIWISAPKHLHQQISCNTSCSDFLLYFYCFHAAAWHISYNNTVFSFNLKPRQPSWTISIMSKWCSNTKNIMIPTLTCLWFSFKTQKSVYVCFWQYINDFSWHQTCLFRLYIESCFYSLLGCFKKPHACTEIGLEETVRIKINNSFNLWEGKITKEVKFQIHRPPHCVSECSVWSNKWGPRPAGFVVNEGSNCGTQHLRQKDWVTTGRLLPLNI